MIAPPVQICTDGLGSLSLSGVIATEGRFSDLLYFMKDEARCQASIGLILDCIPTRRSKQPQSMRPLSRSHG